MMMDYRILRRENGTWDVRITDKGMLDQSIAVGFRSGSEAAQWVASHLGVLEARATDGQIEDWALDEWRIAEARRITGRHSGMLNFNEYRRLVREDVRPVGEENK